MKPGISATLNALQSQSGTSISQQNKAKACNDRADKKVPNGQDRKTVLQACLSKPSNTKSLDDMSHKDKLDAYKGLADKRISRVSV